MRQILPHLLSLLAAPGMQYFFNARTSHLVQAKVGRGRVIFAGNALITLSTIHPITSYYWRPPPSSRQSWKKQVSTSQKTPVWSSFLASPKNTCLLPPPKSEPTPQKNTCLPPKNTCLLVFCTIPQKTPVCVYSSSVPDAAKRLQRRRVSARHASCAAAAAICAPASTPAPAAPTAAS